MRQILYILLALLNSLPLCMQAQTAVWQMRPADYQSVKRFGPQLYQVTQNDKMGLIRPDGSVVVPVGAKRITGFYEHQALVLAGGEGKERILGILHDDGNYYAVNGEYYTLTGLDFCSDGMIPAATSAGVPGYLDDHGNAVLGFNGAWDRIMPFTEGHASVFKDKKYALIDKGGSKARIIIGIGEIYGGTNVYHGEAYIWDVDGNFYTYNPTNNSCKKARQPSETGWDYLYCFSGVSGRNKNIPRTVFSAGAIGLQPKREGSLYGYVTSNGHIVMPCQFSSATPFEDNIAIVTLGNKTGLLKYVESHDRFNITTSQSEYEYKAGESTDCLFKMDMPQVWKNKQIIVTATDKTSQERYNCKLEDGQYSFCLYPDYSERKFDLVVTSEGLTLWKGNMSYTFKKKGMDLQLSLEINNKQANKDNKVIVKAKVHNPCNESVTATLEMRGSSSFEPITQTIIVPAGGDIEVESFFMVRENIENQYVKAYTTAGGTASKSGLTLRKY